MLVFTMSSDDLLRAWRAARDAWPEIDVGLEDFAAHVEQVSEGVSERTRTDDLYLACACARGDERATVAFEKAFFTGVDAVAAALASRGVRADELRQAVRQRLFLGRNGGPGKISTYMGRGELGAWVRVLATRAALNMVSSQVRELLFEPDALAFVVGVGDDPELAYLRRTYADEFRAAFREAFDHLGDREQNLIRYTFGQGLSADAIGTLYNVHRATAARWLVKVHSKLAKLVRKSLEHRLGVTGKDYESIVRLMNGHLQITLESYMKESGPRD